MIISYQLQPIGLLIVITNLLIIKNQNCKYNLINGSIMFGNQVNPDKLVILKQNSKYFQELIKDTN